LTDDAPSYGIEATFVDAGDPGALRAAVRPGRTRLVWIETPSNPLWTITDIAEAADIAHAAGALLAVDSTVPTPVLTRPISSRHTPSNIAVPFESFLAEMCSSLMSR
jgi:cystathionine gamma-synthase